MKSLFSSISFLFLLKSELLQKNWRDVNQGFVIANLIANLS